jgi:uncharacterized membrane protein YphA (DoxX/SURF4 family)
MRGAVWGARCAVILGLIFVYAAWGKIVEPGTFAEAIYHYDVVPHWLANLAAVTLPWVELAAGVCLVIGLWQRPAALLIGALLVFFIGLLAVTWARGIDLDCGCIPGADPRLPPQAIVEDCLMLLLMVPAYRWGEVRWWARGESGDGNG